MDFSVEIFNKDGRLLQVNPAATAGAPTFDSSYANVLGFNRVAWTNRDSVEFWYAEAYNFQTDSSTELFPSVIGQEKGLIRVITQTNKRVPADLWLSCGDQSVHMIQDPNYQNAWYWYFDQTCNDGGGNLKTAIDALNSDKNVLQMTLQPYDSPDPQNQVNQGYRSAVICLGFQNYSTNPSLQFYTIKASIVQKWMQDPNNAGYFCFKQGQVGETWIGGLAAYLLKNSFDLTGNYHLKIDEEINIGGCLSCAVARNTSLPVSDENVTLGALHLSGAWTVEGTHRINGYQYGYLCDNDIVGAQRQIQCGLLDISTDYIPQFNEPAIDLAGPTFAYPGKRNKGSVQLNALDMYECGDPTQTFNDRINILLKNLGNGNAVSREKFHKVQVFDTKLIGGWWDASDGIETMAPNSHFDRNFIQTADDSIKLRARNVSYENTTIWQGDSGAAINPGAYGYVNGSVAGCSVAGVFIHRVTQKLHSYYCGPTDQLMQDDDMGGLVSNRTGFSNEWFAPINQNELHLSDVDILGVYVPSLKYGKLDANSIGRLCVLGALNPGFTGDCTCTRVQYLPVPTSSKYCNLTIDFKQNTWDFSGVNFKTSFDKGAQFSSGMICVGNYFYCAANRGYSDYIPYSYGGSKTRYTAHLIVIPPKFKFSQGRRR